MSNEGASLRRRTLSAMGTKRPASSSHASAQWSQKRWLVMKMWAFIVARS